MASSPVNKTIKDITINKCQPDNKNISWDPLQTNTVNNYEPGAADVDGGGGTNVSTLSPAQQIMLKKNGGLMPNSTTATQCPIASSTQQYIGNTALRNGPQTMYNSYGNSYSPYNNRLYGGGYQSSYGSMYDPMRGITGGLGAMMPYTHSTMGVAGYGAAGYLNQPMHPGNPGIIAAAQQSTAGVFEKAASVVHALGSMTFMMDTVFMSCTGSFNAVLDVINSFSQMSNQFSRIMSAFAVVRSIKWLYYRLLRLLGVINTEDMERVWSEAVKASAAQVSPNGASNNKKSILQTVLVVMLISLPILLWKLVKEMAQEGAINPGTGVPHVPGGAEPFIPPQANGYLNYGSSYPTNYAAPLGYGAAGGYGVGLNAYNYGGYGSTGYSRYNNPYMGGASTYGGAPYGNRYNSQLGHNPNVVRPTNVPATNISQSTSVSNTQGQSTTDQQNNSQK